MVVGNTDGPLFDRQLDRLRSHPPALVEALLGAGAPEDERAGIGGVGEKVVHRPIARPRPADASLPDRPPRQLLAFGDQLQHHLARRAESPPQAEHPLDRVAHLLVGRGDDAVVVCAVKADRQREPKLAALGL